MHATLLDHGTRDGGMTEQVRPALFTSIETLLDQLASLLGSLDDKQFIQAPVGTITSSIGAHVRHCLDHVRELLEGIIIGEMNFDVRKRGTDVERDRLLAIAEIRMLRSKLEVLSEKTLDYDIRLTLLPSADAPSMCVRTSVAREAAYVLSHTIHHNAIIAAAAKMLGLTPPDRFGYAPSTIAAAKGGPCAR